MFLRGLSSLALMLVVTIPSERSAIYESRVYACAYTPPAPPSTDGTSAKTTEIEVPREY